MQTQQQVSVLEQHSQDSILQKVLGKKCGDTHT